MFSLKNKVAIVTGASQGIGKEISLSLAKNGAKVICISRNEEALKSVIRNIKKIVVLDKLNLSSDLTPSQSELIRKFLDSGDAHVKFRSEDFARRIKKKY